MFGADSTNLKKLLNYVDRGYLQLPDFQRDWVWTDEDVRQLLASVAAAFPIGAILTLETGGNLKLKSRTLEHAPETDGDKARKLLLDGQQRMTALYQTLKSQGPVRTKGSRGKPMSLYYYINMQRALDDKVRLEDAIVAVPDDKILRGNSKRDIKLDLHTRELECQQFMFPLNKALNFDEWLLAFTDEHGRDKMSYFQKFRERVIEHIADYEVPVITLEEANTREAVCTVFEKVNVGGKKLDVFELLTAIFAADGFDLREDLRGKGQREGRLSKIKGPDKESGVFDKLFERDVLQVACAIHTHAERKGKISIRASDLLKLDCNDYQKKYADEMTRGFEEARRFLGELSIVRGTDMPNLTVAKTVAAVYALMGKNGLNAVQRDRLAQWFWAATLGEWYGASTDTRVASDIQELLDWLKGGDKKPQAIGNINIRADRLDELKTRGSVMYKALYAAILGEGCQDFRTGEPASAMHTYDDPVDMHHIFPKKWADNNNIDSNRYNSIINKTPLDAPTNRMIGARAPSEYLEKLEGELASTGGGGVAKEQLDRHLESHLINPDLLRADKFDAFYEDRKEKLLKLIERKTGRKIPRDDPKA